MLNINEIFRSIDGEVNAWGQGILTTFIRLQGCNLFCAYCDTKYAQDRDKKMHEMSVEDIVKIIPGTNKVTITGGEPLLQKETVKLIIELMNLGIKVSVETNGSIPIPIIIGTDFDFNLSWVMDYKLHAADKMCINNFWNATSQDWIKFVIENPADFQKAVNITEALKRGAGVARIAFSPAMKNNDIRSAQWLAERMIEKQLDDVVFNLQIHKLIWPVEKEGSSLL
jgi:7-carboxy-7-deazaguanine synthase